VTGRFRDGVWGRPYIYIYSIVTLSQRRSWTSQKWKYKLACHTYIISWDQFYWKYVCSKWFKITLDSHDTNKLGNHSRNSKRDVKLLLLFCDEWSMQTTDLKCE